MSDERLTGGTYEATFRLASLLWNAKINDTLGVYGKITLCNGNVSPTPQKI